LNSLQGRKYIVKLSHYSLFQDMKKLKKTNEGGITDVFYILE